jgi:hypothetical protein
MIQTSTDSQKKKRQKKKKKRKKEEGIDMDVSMFVVKGLTLLIYPAYFMLKCLHKILVDFN